MATVSPCGYARGRRSSSVLGESLVAFTAVVAVRTVLELVLDAQHRVLYYDGSYLDLVTYANAYVSWLATALLFWLVARLWLPLESLPAARLVCTLLPIIWIVPPINWLATRGAGGELFYGEGWSDLWFNMLHLFNPAAEISMAPAGVRAEIFLVTLAALALAPVAFGISHWRSLGMALTVYVAIFSLGYLPMLHGIAYDLLGLRNGPVADEVPHFFHIYLVPVLLLAAAMIVVLRREGRLERGLVTWLFFPSRLLFYLFLVGFGFFFVGHREPGLLELLQPPLVWRLLSAYISVALLFAWARTTNDLHDLDIDRVSNVERPLVAGVIDRRETARLSWVWFSLSLLFAVPTAASFLPYWLLVAALAYLYSTPPIRLRRFYPVAPGVLAALATALFCGGASLVDSSQVYADTIETGVAPAVMAAAFFLAHLKDLKDLDGDRAGGVHNLFNWLPAKRVATGAVVVAFAGSVAVLMGGLGLHRPLPLAVLGLFVAGSLLWIVRARNLRELERLLLLALGLLGVQSVLWLVEQAVSALR